MSASDGWTAAVTAEDFLAQIEDAMEARWTRSEAVETLVIQGVEEVTAGCVWDEVRRAAEAAGRLGTATIEPIIDPIDEPVDGTGSELDANTPQTQQTNILQVQRTDVDVSASARWIRAPGDQLTIEVERIERLVDAFHQAGLLRDTASRLVNEIAAREQLVLGVFRERNRRLGKQGMVGGALFTLLLVSWAVAVGGSAYWHLSTALATLLLTVYSAILYRSGRPPRLR